MYKNLKLTCSNCNKSIQSNENFSVILSLPNKFVMPVGRLDAMIAQRGKQILCAECYKKN
jgi:hypothetical protein